MRKRSDSSAFQCGLSDASTDSSETGAERAILRGRLATWLTASLSMDDAGDRTALLAQLLAAAQEADPHLAALIEGRADRRPKRPRAADIVEAFYLAGAANGPTLGEQVAHAAWDLRAAIRTGGAMSPVGYWIEFHKTYSSYTPRIDGASPRSLGGGYYLKLGDYGCVVDPGYHFLDNYFSSTRTLDDIHGIIVTHCHDDHFTDLPALLSLMSQRRSDEPNRILDIFLDAGTYRMFRPMVGRPRQDGHGQRRILQPVHNAPITLTPGVVLRTLPTRHKVFGKNGGVGLLVDIQPRKTLLLITGDTGWDSDIERAYRQALRRFRDRQVVLVAHVSSAKPQEALGALAGQGSPFYGNHLCIHGLCRAIEAVRPKVVILSEIGEELDRVLNPLVDLIKRAYPRLKCVVGNLDHAKQWVF